MTHHHDSWEKFLNPATLRGNLIGIALFIAAFEMFKETVIEKPVSMLCNGFDQNGLIISQEYQEEVLSRSKSKLTASLLWIQEQGGIDQSDVEAFDAIRKHRNELTHEMMAFLSDSQKSVNLELFQNLIGLLTKIEKWWFEYFELAIDPEMLPEGANAADVIPGPVWSLQLMLDIALGNEPEEGYYFNEYQKKKT